MQAEIAGMKGMAKAVMLVEKGTQSEEAERREVEI